MRNIKSKDNSLEIAVSREQYIVKSNTMIQKSRFDLSFSEQRAISYIVSLVRPESNELWYEFDVRKYAEICGIDQNGTFYEDTRELLKGIRNKSWWIEQEDGGEATVAWFSNVITYKRSGKVKIKFDELMMPFIFNLLENYTQYSLLNTLAMKSQYSSRIYELLISYSWRFKKYKTKTGIQKFNLDDLKKRLNVQEIPTYDDFGQLRRKVLDISVKEINEYTDILIDYTPVKKGRKVIEIEFKITYKESFDVMKSNHKASVELND